MPEAAAGARGEEARSCAVPGAVALLCTGNFWEAEPWWERSSHGCWVFLRLPRLPDGNPLEHSLNTAQPPQQGSLLAEVLAKAIVLTPFFNIYFRMSLTGGRVEGTPNLIP